MRDLKNEWIAISERMPEHCGMPVLLIGVNNYGQKTVFYGFTGYMERGKLNFYNNTMYIDMKNYKLTHWLPIPDYPNEKIKEQNMYSEEERKVAEYIINLIGHDDCNLRHVMRSYTVEEYSDKIFEILNTVAKKVSAK